MRTHNIDETIVCQHLQIARGELENLMPHNYQSPDYYILLDVSNRLSKVIAHLLDVESLAEITPMQNPGLQRKLKGEHIDGMHDENNPLAECALCQGY